jgi:hypothetical protein
MFTAAMSNRPDYFDRYEMSALDRLTSEGG